MKRNSTIRFTWILTLVSVLFTVSNSNAAVTIGPAGGGTCLNVTPGAYTQINWITIRESLNNDYASPQTGATLILTAPTGFEFNPGVGTLNVTGSDITNTSLAVTSTSITVTFDVTGTSTIDRLQIRQIQVRALVPNTTGDIVRPAVGGGTAVINGDAAGAGISHASLTATGSGLPISSIAAGDWSNPATWVGGLVPSCSDVVTVAHAVTVDRTIVTGTVTINSTGTLTADNDITVNSNFNINSGGIYIHNNTKDVSTTVFAGAESFDPNSTIQIDDWYDDTRPLAEFVSGDFGNVVFNNPGTWQNSGMFSPNVIKGDITISAGTVVMDEGAGMTTSLTLQNVTINNTGRVIFAQGADRNLTLVMNNYTDVASTTSTSKVMSNTMGTLDWTVNGDMTVSRNFTVLEGAGVADVADVTITVTGDLSITGGDFVGVKSATSSFDLTVNGDTDISGTSSSVSMIRDFSGDLTFSTTNLTISTGDKNNFMGGSGGAPTGDATFNINNDFIVNGASTRVYLYINTASTGTVDLNVGRDLLLTDGEMNLGSTSADIIADVSRNLDISGAGALFFGQRNTSNADNVILTVNGHLHLTSGLFTQHRGLGSAVLTVTEEIQQNGGTFYVVNNATSGNYGTVNLTMSDLDFNGGEMNVHRGYLTDGRQVVIDITNNADINFASSSDELYFIRRAGVNNAQLLLSIGGNMVIDGDPSGYFQSSYSQGSETITISGNMIINDGTVRFNGLEDGSGGSHDVAATISGSVFVNGGSLGLSVNSGTSSWDIQGEYIQTGGHVFHKYRNGASDMTVGLNYEQTGGITDLFGGAASTALNQVTLTINGDATFANTTFNFDSSATSTSEHELRFNGTDFNVGANAIFTHANHLSSNMTFGRIIYQTAGTANYNRTAATSDIQHVKQTVIAGTTLDVSGSVNDLLIASNSSATEADYTTLTVDGTIDLAGMRIYPRQQANYYAGVDVNGTIITGHADGLYNAMNGNSAIYPLISGVNNMDYNLDFNSAVVYNGTDNQVVTGINQGIAVNASHRYGILEIDFQGTPDAEWVYPMNDDVYVRNDLRLTDGEFNLDIDHDAVTGGRLLHIEDGATISRVNGYLRSETIDGTAAVEWTMTTPGAYLVPFGYNSGIYLPFTFQPTSGSAGATIMATYHSNADNTPYPPTVTHTRDNSGVDNSANTVDRFWRLEVPGSVTATLLFNYAAAEGTGIVSPRAQRWEPVSEGWEPPLGVQSNPTGTSTLASGLTGLGTWWTLSSSSSPLPIQLLSFNAFPDNGHVKLVWTTASELNNDHFTVMRSSDGENFFELFDVPGAGTSNVVNNYTAVDSRPLFGISYYRLRQTDYNGKETFHQIRKVNFQKKVPVSVFPNPLRNGMLTVSTGNVEDRIDKVTVYDITGKLITELNFSADVYRQASVVIELGENVPEGTYMLVINSGSGVHRERLIKQ